MGGRGSLGWGLRNLVAANVSSSLGDGVAKVAAPLLAVRLTDDPLLVSAVAAVAMLPWLLLAVPAGILVDRVDRRGAMGAASGARALLAVLLLVLVASDALTIWWLCAVVFAYSALETVYDGALRAVVPSIVARADLARANSRIEAGEIVVERFLSGPLTSALFAVSVLVPLGLNALTYAVAGLLVLLLPHVAAGARRTDPSGFGERFDAVDQRGRSLDCVVFEQYKSQGVHGRTYLPMPFCHVLGGDGWGLHVRTSRRAWFDVAATEPDRMVVTVDLGGAPDEHLDLSLPTGAPHEVLRAFGDEVGRAEELPDWVFRLWASGNEWNTQDLVMARMDSHRELDIPVGVVVIEAWSDEEGITIFRDARYDVTPDGAAHQAGDFTYPADGAWPDPKAMIDELHSRGIKVVLWQIPLQKTEHDLGPAVPNDSQVLTDGRAMVENSHAVREADGTAYHNRGWWFPQALMADLTTQAGRDWWTDKRRYLVADLDVDGFKTDGGEHAWGHDLRYADGRRGDEGNNLYPVHYAKAFGDLLRSEGKAPVTFSRAGFAGSQAHGVFWAGDEDSTWEAFRNSVTAGITASACGIVYWGWDLAGFSGPVPDAELYLRAAAASTFMPVMQYHSEFNHHRRPLRDRTPWFVAEVNDDPSVVEVFRAYTQLRERLVPYLTDQARRTIATDMPLMRGLFMQWPTDQRVWEWPGQFLLGDDLLVHPVTDPGVRLWQTYLPAGDWVDVWTGQAHTGGAVVLREVPREVVPVYCRASAWPSLQPIFAG